MTADLLDPRQREAACLLLAAVELPAPADQVAKLWLAAAKVCPGIKVDSALLGQRRKALERAREILDALLAETP